MSGVYILEPHADDAALFCAFSALRERARVITVLRSHVQESRGDGITADQRTAESRAAVEGVLGLGYHQWPFRDDAPDWDGILDAIRELDAARIYVPAAEDRGHEDHNALCRVAHRAVDGRKIVRYLTYTMRGKSKWGTEVRYEPAWLRLKMRALLCYESQITHPMQAEHFLRSWREYIA